MAAGHEGSYLGTIIADIVVEGGRGRAGAAYKILELLSCTENQSMTV